MLIGSLRTRSRGICNLLRSKSYGIKSFHFIDHEYKFCILRYGNLVYIEVGPFRQILIGDMETMQDLFSMDVFQGRGDPSEMFKSSVFRKMKGGTGKHGLIGSEGEMDIKDCH